MSRVLMLILAAASFLAAACGDPVHDNDVAALGAEASNVPAGPEHRPGQPCLACHGGSGPASFEMRFGGTVYAVRGQSDPLADVTVQLTDAAGSTISTTTNGVGNFFVPAASWSPVFPVHVAMSYRTQTAKMTTHIGRDGSCGDCHFSPAGPTSPGPVFFFLDPEDVPGADASAGATP